MDDAVPLDASGEVDRNAQIELTRAPMLYLGTSEPRLKPARHALGRMAIAPQRRDPMVPPPDEADAEVNVELLVDP